VSAPFGMSHAIIDIDKEIRKVRVPTQQPNPRFLQWDACLNVRDLGDFPTHGGAETRWGALIRADTLCRLTPAGCKALVAHGVRTIVDLRFPEEIARLAHPFRNPVTAHNGVQYLNVPITTGRDPVRDAEVLAAFATVQSPVESYQLELDANPKGLARIATAVAQAPVGGVVVHCHAGKDRTGIVVALLLSLVGVADDLIADDYALSMVGLQSELDRWLAAMAPTDPVERSRLERMQLAEPETMLQTLAYLAERYGGAERYLRSGGMAEHDIATIRDRLCTAPAVD